MSFCRLDRHKNQEWTELPGFLMGMKSGEFLGRWFQLMIFFLGRRFLAGFFA